MLYNAEDVGKDASDVTFPNKGSTLNSYEGVEIPNDFLDKAKESIFNVRSLSHMLDDAKKQPPPRKLCGSLIYEHEQVILFAKTGIGKSIFATQIALSVARGEDLDLGNGIVLENEVGEVNTAYFDFELSDVQNLKRIKEEPCPENLYYIKINRGSILEGTPKEIFKDIKKGAERFEAKFIIIDNISKISGDLEKSENAKIFSSELWMLCRHHGYTILLIAHTPKLNRNDPITEDSIAGSSKMGQLADGIIGMNWADDSEGKNLYIKQIKNRNGEKEYGANNVICTNIGVSNTGLVRHYCYDSMSEKDALNSNNKGYKDQRRAVISYTKNGTYRGAGGELGIHHATVKKRVNNFKESNPEEFIEIGKNDNDELNRLLDTFN